MYTHAIMDADWELPWRRRADRAWRSSGKAPGAVCVTRAKAWGQTGMLAAGGRRSLEACRWTACRRRPGQPGLASFSGARRARQPAGLIRSPRSSAGLLRALARGRSAAGRSSLPRSSAARAGQRTLGARRLLRCAYPYPCPTPTLTLTCLAAAAAAAHPSETLRQSNSVCLAHSLTDKTTDKITDKARHAHRQGQQTRQQTCLLCPFALCDLWWRCEVPESDVDRVILIAAGRLARMQGAWRACG